MDEWIVEETYLFTSSLLSHAYREALQFRKKERKKERKKRLNERVKFALI